MSKSAKRRNLEGSADLHDGSHAKKAMRKKVKQTSDKQTSESSSADNHLAPTVVPFHDEKVDQADLKKIMDVWSSYSLKEDVYEALARLKYFEPTKVQKDFLLQYNPIKTQILGSETGSGKTLAYLLPSFKTLFSGVTLIIVPTRELCRQVRDFLYRLRPRNSTVAIHGGISIEKQLRLISKNIEYIVATPGRLWDICQSDEGSVLVEKLSSNEARLIIDEADKLFEMRKFKELDNLLRFFYRFDNFNRFPLFVSATASNLENSKSFQELLELIGQKKDFQVISCSGQEEIPWQKINFLKLEISQKDRELMLFSTLMDIKADRTLIFCNSIQVVKKVNKMLKYAKFTVFALHSDMEMVERFKLFEKFQNSRSAILIATDVAARGMNFSVDLVINFHVPRELDTFIHRSGRTARMKKEGTVVFMVSAKESTIYKKFISEKLESQVSSDIKIEKYVPVSANVGKAREIYPLLVRLEKLEYMKNHSNQEKSWERKIIEACDLENSDSESENNSKRSSKQQQEMVEQKRRKLEKKSILQKLDNLLS